MLRKVQSAARIAACQGLKRAAEVFVNRLAGKPDIPTNTIEANLETWQHYDWSRSGEEWSPSEAWEASVVEHILEPNIPTGSRVLEIGPGGGRWTRYLVGRARHLTLVDLTPRCIQICRERFQSASNIEFHVNDGRDLGFVPTGSVDRIWSHDVFVHIQAADIENYVQQFPALLAPGGTAIIHHSKDGVFAADWRSDMTAQTMRDMAARHNLQIVDQIVTWNHGRCWFPAGNLSGENFEKNSVDIISILKKPF